jgi:hypothetical protein
VDVQVEHGLPRRCAVELRDDDPVRFQGRRRRLRHALHALHQRPAPLRRQFQEVARAHTLRDHQRVPARLREDVHERQRLVVLEHLHGGKVAAEDFREDVVVVVDAVKAHGRCSAYPRKR